MIVPHMADKTEASFVDYVDDSVFADRDELLVELFGPNWGREIYRFAYLAGYSSEDLADF